jgi:hypothetical protein
VHVQAGEPIQVALIEKHSIVSLVDAVRFTTVLVSVPKVVDYEIVGSVIGCKQLFKAKVTMHYHGLMDSLECIELI